jgi:TPR repeat protein
MHIYSKPWELAFQGECGDADAQFELGIRFLLGESMVQDPEAAYRWLALAATNEHPGAQRLLVHLGFFCPIKPRDTLSQRVTRCMGAQLHAIADFLTMCRRKAEARKD